MTIKEAFELKNIKVLGYTTDYNQCDCCGRDALKGTYTIVDLDTEVIMHFGSTCAVNANKYDNYRVLAYAKKEVAKLAKRHKSDMEKIDHLLSRPLHPQYGQSELVDICILFNKYESLKSRILEWFAQNEIVIDENNEFRFVVHIKGQRVKVL